MEQFVEHFTKKLKYTLPKKIKERYHYRSFFITSLFISFTRFCRSEKYRSSAFFLAFAASSNFLKVPIWICFLSTVIYALYLSRHTDTPVIPVSEFLFFLRPNPAYATDSPFFSVEEKISFHRLDPFFP